MSKIFHPETASASAAPQAATEAPAAAAASGGAAASDALAAARAVDVEAVLDGFAAKAAQRLDWRHSIVDLMKLLELDSGLSARRRLAEELHYTGNSGDTAAMNFWLHEEVMQKLAESGGKVPDDLKR